MKLQDIFATFQPLDQAIRKPYMIAEAGVNHEGSMEIAKRLIDEAKKGGADAIKFQTYKASTLASKHSPAYWDTSKEPTTSQFELFSKHDKFWKNEMEQLKRYCDDSDIEFLSTPFDVESANFLNDMMPAFKISSSDLTNKAFIRHMAQFGKPIILSTGASHLWEIQEAVSWIETYSNALALLHCVLNYPTMDENAHLGMLQGLKQAFPNNIIGYSDHTLPKEMKVCEIATLLGARIIEKHFTHDKTLPGNDHYHAMDKDDLKRFYKNLDWILSVVGTNKVEALPEEEPARQNARRSLVAAADIPAGTIIRQEHLTFKRPAHGISAREFDTLIGMEVIQPIQEDDVLQWWMVKKS